MPINYLKGDVTRGPEEALGHGCNCRKAFGAGVARAVAMHWPEVRRKYMELASPDKLGQIQTIKVKGKIVVNMFTQLNYGRGGQRYVSYDAIENCFKLMREWAEEKKIKSIAIPYIGSGLAGGNWKEIIKRIEKVWNGCKVELNIYSFK